MDLYPSPLGLGLSVWVSANCSIVTKSQAGLQGSLDHVAPAASLHRREADPKDSRKYE